MCGDYESPLCVQAKKPLQIESKWADLIVWPEPVEGPHPQWLTPRLDRFALKFRSQINFSAFRNLCFKDGQKNLICPQ